METKFTGQTKRIRIGTVVPRYRHIWGKDAYISIYRFGVMLALAKSRYGKSALAKDLCVKLSEHRKIAIFDILGEWKGHITERNWYAKIPMNMQPKIIENFAFYVSDFNNVSDWMALGFPPRGAQVICEIASLSELHENNLKKISMMIHDLPLNDLELEDYREEYYDLASKIPPNTRDAIIQRWEGCKYCFMDASEEDKIYIDDWIKEFMENDHLLINLDLRGPAQKIKAQAYVGKILELWKPALKYLKPFLVFEEADYLFPNIDYDFPSSLEIGMEYAVKLQKNDICMLLLSQSEEQLHPVLEKNAHQRILGHLPPRSKHYDITKNLKWDYDHNSREFVCVDMGGNWCVFKPDIASCEV